MFGIRVRFPGEACCQQRALLSSNLKLWLPKNTVLQLFLSGFLNVGGPGRMRTARNSPVVACVDFVASADAGPNFESKLRTYPGHVSNSSEVRLLSIVDGDPAGDIAQREACALNPGRGCSSTASAPVGRESLGSRQKQCTRCCLGVGRAKSYAAGMQPLACGQRCHDLGV